MTTKHPSTKEGLEFTSAIYRPMFEPPLGLISCISLIYDFMVQRLISHYKSNKVFHKLIFILCNRRGLGVVAGEGPNFNLIRSDVSAMFLGFLFLYSWVRCPHPPYRTEKIIN